MDAKIGSDVQSMKEKLYVVVDGCLNGGQKLAQSNHAVTMMFRHHPSIMLDWMDASNTIVVLQVGDKNKSGEDKLKRILKKAIKYNIQTAHFKEPDLDGRLTSIVLAPNPQSAHICKKLRLAD